MLLRFLVTAFMVRFGLAQTTCIKHTPVQPGTITLKYTPYVTPQIGPTTTEYGMIVTTWYNAVDCNYVSIERVDDNLPAIGPFTTRITVDTLTITRIGCMQHTSASTRGEDDHHSVTSDDFNHRAARAAYDRRVVRSSSRKHEKRATLQSDVLAIATQQGDSIPPETQSMSVRAYGYLVQVNTALFALNLYNAGFNMSATCTLLSDPITQARLMIASVNPSQAASIICYAAQNGLFFNMSNSQLLSDLLGIIYSIDVKSGFTTNTTAICTDLQLGAAAFLGIDTYGLEDYICEGNNRPTALPIFPPSASASSGLGTAGTGGTVMGTSAGTNDVSLTTVPPFANATAYGSTTGSLILSTEGPAQTTRLGETAGSVGSVTYGTGPSTTWIASTGSGGIWSNVTQISTPLATPTGTGQVTVVSATGSETFTLVFPNNTVSANDSMAYTVRLLPTPYPEYSYDVWTTSTTSESYLPRY